jgi:hypothetical protein
MSAWNMGLLPAPLLYTSRTSSLAWSRGTKANNLPVARQFNLLVPAFKRYAKTDRLHYRHHGFSWGLAVHTPGYRVPYQCVAQPRFLERDQRVLGISDSTGMAAELDVTRGELDCRDDVGAHHRLLRHHEGT